jgi:hypothetical protein
MPGVSRAREHLVELGFEHGLQEVASSISKASFDRVEPVVEKMFVSLDFRLRQEGRRAMARHGVISARRVNAGFAC